MKDFKPSFPPFLLCLPLPCSAISTAKTR